MGLAVRLPFLPGYRQRGAGGCSMYGLVNKALEDLVCAQFGEETWDRMVEVAGIEEVGFISVDTYDDQITYRLVEAGTQVLGLSACQLLEAFGEHWTRYTAEEGYGDLMLSFGTNMGDFLTNLNDLHVRVTTTLPQLRPPHFQAQRLPDGKIELIYKSERPGLAPMVVGLLRGLGKRFGHEVEIEHTGLQADAGYDTFLITCKDAA